MQKIVSGGQTGVDRAALDVALQAAFPCGGWCPQGRLAEDGAIENKYPLRETPSTDYAVRTEWNVRDSDGTLILSVDKLTGGTALTRSLARRMGKPCLVVNLENEPDVAAVVAWLRTHKINDLNVAGSRESQQPGIHTKASTFLRSLLAEQQDP